MEIARFLAVAVLLVGNTSAELFLQITDEGNGLEIYHDSLKLIEQSSASPAVYLGHGDAYFTDDAGNFELDEDISIITPLPLSEVITSTPNEIVIVLRNDLDATVAVELRFLDDASTVTFGVKSLETVPETYNRIWVRIFAEEDEYVYGAGEQFTYFNLRGHEFPIWTSEQGVGRGDRLPNVTIDSSGHYYTTYWPQSSYFSSSLYSLLIYEYNYMVLDFSDPSYHELFSHSTSLEMEFVFGSSAMEVTQAVAGKLGLQPMLPDWIMTGAILGLQEGTEQVMYYYEMAREAHVNVSALWIQDWSGKIDTYFGHRVYWNWELNETYYPGLEEMVTELAAEGVQVTVYCNPHLIEGSDLFEDAASSGHLMLDQNGEIYLTDFGGFFGGTVDLLDTDSNNWYRDVLRTNILDLGFKGWMADFGEYTGLDAVSKNTELTPEEVHNLIPRAWAETNRHIVETGNAVSSAVYWMRSGALGSSGFQTLAWAGDQNVDFSTTDGVATTIVAALSLSVSGMGLTHFDIGGYTTQFPMVRTQELFLRSAEYSVFTPVMRTHEGNKPDSNHQFYSSNETLTQFARLTQMHAMLLPYTKAIVEENAVYGTPVQRPLFLHFPDEEASWTLQEQYMYGPDLVVAPVIHQGMTEVTLYLPGTIWYSLFAVSSPVQGPIYSTVDVPIGYPAVFYREGSDFTDLFEAFTEEFGINA